MSETLVYADTLQRIGHTVIDGERVVQYTCSIPLSNPKDMRLTSTRLKPDLYKANRETCRKDLEEFEDMAYELQDQYLESTTKAEG